VLALARGVLPSTPMAGGKEDWRRVRVLRAKPPGLAEQDDERRHMFQAALSQSEELWEAAAVIGPASRPLPLFYCVSQAGRAVCAAWSLAEEWRPRGHGLKRHVSDDPDPAKRVFDHAASVDDRPLGIYGMVVDAIRSVAFAGQASVAELWASLPGFPTVDPNVAGHPPYPIRLERAQARKLALTKPENLEGESLLKLIATPTRAVIRSRHPGPPEELPETYPTMSGIEQDGTQPDPLGDEEPVFKFVGEDGNPRLLSRVGSRPHDDPRSFTKFVVRPKVGEAAIGPPSEFLVSWALLFCLSELARYYPDAWVLTLNPDTSTVAVTIEAGLDFALDRAPALISQALRGPVPVLRNE
jgi:hypothetical protein